MGRCGSLGSLQSLLSHASQLSGASILHFSHSKFLSAHCREWLQPECCEREQVFSFLSALRTQEFSFGGVADDCDILVYYMAGNTPFLSIQQVMAGIGAKTGPGLRGRMGRSEACEESIKRLWVDVGRRRKNNPRSVWLLGDDKATPEEGPPAGGAGCGGGNTSGVEPQVCGSQEATKGPAQGGVLERIRMERSMRIHAHRMGR